ncbi:Ig-like domain-containing protein [Roseateles amylovorans]|uniref:Ig-like domain-containing protein n=1 Tax=Roseateles amylovorans TaxID=2978473 RepID=A0ABY6B803_9BURK|nr:Ig-like domain-containing protein [Roseateles amylovorans]UXH79341.1 Ig-like domain-containing protein [Roseateles amylovorans]
MKKIDRQAMSGQFTGRVAQIALTATMVAVLTACGGGGGDAGDPVIGGGTGSGGATVTVSDLSMTLDKTSITNSGSDTVVTTLTAVDANRAVVANVPVSFSVNNGATITVINATTDTTGKAVANVQIGADKSNRLVTVTATSGSLTRTATFQVTGADLDASAVPTTPTAGSSGNTVQYRLSDVNDNAIANAPIAVTAPGLTAANGTTDANGAFTFTYTAPTTPGPIDISATAGGVTKVATVTVPSTTSTIPAVTTVVASSAVSANPTVLNVNSTGITTNRAELRALFLGANNSPIKNIRVRFDMNGDVNSIGGTISSGSALVYTDSAGAATTSYYPASRPSPTNGVTIRACWDYADFAATACPNTLTTTLTVVSDPLSISIGTDNTLAEGTSKLTYVKRFVVLVVDAAGNPKADVQITPSLDLTSYMKGAYAVSGTSWSAFHSLDGVTTGGRSEPCLNEDLNRNGSIDTGDDKNLNGQLDPRKSDASISFEGATKTDSSGTAVIKLEYPKSVATWVNYTVTVSAFGVLSPPATYSSTLSALATDFTSATVSPAFQVSPYGTTRLSGESYCSTRD